MVEDGVALHRKVQLEVEVVEDGVGLVYKSQVEVDGVASVEEPWTEVEVVDEGVQEMACSF